MKFPKWVMVDRPTPDVLATRRLRFLVSTASIWGTESGSVTALCERTGIAPSKLYESVRKGGFSMNQAMQIEKACGREVVRREWLIWPLDIAEMV
jgi:hypothetical protein